MRKLLVILLISLFTIPLAMPIPVAAATIYIYDVNDLQDMNLDLTADYILANSINASATSGWNWDGSYYKGFVPIGQTSPYFTGTFDGNGYTISGLFINRPTEDEVGLFGYTEGAVIQDVQLVNVDITGDDHVGGLIGYPDTSTITNCSVSGTVVGDSWCGGMIGFAYLSSITTCRSSAVITSTSYGHQLGGLVGESLETDITNSHATGSVTTNGFFSVGGFIGEMRNGDIFKCYATGDVTAGDADNSWGASEIGGFVGGAFEGGTISKCFSTGDVIAIDGTSSTAEGNGGFVGDLYYVAISNCYARGNVTSTTGGGFAGTNDGSIDKCYSTGLVTGGAYCGGLIATGDDPPYWNVATNSFWDKETSGQATSDSGTGLTTLQAKTTYTYTDAGWDFCLIWAMDICVNDGYPFLRWYYPWAGDYDIYQVVWFQPNAIIEGVILPNRAGGGIYQDGEIHWGDNPADITISHGELIPEEEYDFEPIIPSGQDIIKPEPEIMTGDVDLERLRNNPLHPLVQILSIDGFLNERLVWLGLAWLIVIVAMLGVHLGFDTRKDTEKPQHFILTTITGLGLSILFYTWGIFPLWVVILMAFGLLGAIIWERQPVI